eukprot:gene16119-13343_t
MRGISYWLGKTIYVSVTNRACGLSLLASRGPSFVMPEASGFTPLSTWVSGSDQEPTVDQIVDVVVDAYANDERKANPVLKRNDGLEVDAGVVFAGLGDPLLRLDTICEAATRIRIEQPDVPVAVYTNGLSHSADPGACAAALKDAGISRVTVALNASNPPAYMKMMVAPSPPALLGSLPSLYADAAANEAEPAAWAAHAAIGDVGSAGFQNACAFVVALVENGIAVTTTCVGVPGVDVAGTRALGEALGSVEFKVRDWH